MNMQPVSVIIPTYNRKHFLPRAVNSVLSQTWRCGELIIVDDGSTDGTSDYIDTLKRQNIMPVRSLIQKNSGPAAARNTGILHAQYEYITFLDSDDHWNKRKIEKQLGLLLKNPGYLISHTREKWLRRGEHLNQKKKHIPRHGDIYSHCLELCAVGMSTVMMRRELFNRVGLFDESFRCCEDYDFWLHVSCQYHFLLVDEPLTVKEGGRDDQVSQQYRVGMDKLRILALEKLITSNHLSTDQLEEAYRELMKKCTIYGNGCIRHGKEIEGKTFLKKVADYKKESAKRVS